MHPNDPLPRLLRLHGMVVRAAPRDGTSLSHSDAEGLTDAYRTLRSNARALVSDLGMSTDDFDQELVELGPAPRMAPNPNAMLDCGTRASTAATLLRALRGYVEGLITMTMLTEDLTQQQLDLVRDVVSH